MEIEENNTFLDMKMSKSKNFITFGIFRKPTQPDLVIPKNSNHPHQYKLCFHRNMKKEYNQTNYNVVILT